MAKDKMVLLTINIDSLNKGLEQFKVYQRDTETVRVPVGITSKVPLWVAEIAIQAGDATDYVDPTTL